MNYFTIERGRLYIDHIVLRNNEGHVVFGDYFNLSYDEMKSREDLSDFVLAVMEATDASAEWDNDQTIITLIGEDDVFVWSIIMGTVDSDVRYSLVDWTKDGKKYRYEVENNA